MSTTALDKTSSLISGPLLCQSILTERPRLPQIQHQLLTDTNDHPNTGPYTDTITSTTIKRTNASSSTRAKSRKNRVFVFYNYLVHTYKEILHLGENCAADESNRNDDQDDDQDDRHDDCYNIDTNMILDVAGGKGDLSWIMSNLHSSIKSIVIDPRPTKHNSLVKSVAFLEKHPNVVKERSVVGLPTYQPLASLLPSMIANRNERIRRKRMIKTNNAKDQEEGEDNDDDDDDDNQWRKPRNMQIYMDDKLVKSLHSQKIYEEGLKQKQLILVQEQQKQQNGVQEIELFLEKNPISSTWQKYWEESNIYYDKSNENNKNSNSVVSCAKEAYQLITKTKLIVGFHPDQATEAIIDMALLLQIPFCIVPCCVFPCEFPNRKIKREDGTFTKVRDYHTFLEYLRNKDERIKVDQLDFQFTETARNVVLYMTCEDFL